MTSKDFIIKSINEIVSSFPYLNLRYEFDKFSYSHFIEVRPDSSYRNDEDYIEMEKRIYLRFIDLFPIENLTFLSDKSFYKIENPIYEKGFINDDLKLTYNINIETLNLFKNYKAEFPKDLTSKFSEKKTVQKYNTILTSNTRGVNFATSELRTEFESQEIEVKGEFNFGLAA